VTASVAPIGIIELYRAYSDGGVSRARARQVLDQQHWYASIAEFDPKTGDALPLAFDEVLHRLGRRTETNDIRDRLWRIVDHCRLSLEHIFASLSENPRREQAYLPIRDVKELNAASFIALSRRPGRNVREKLAGKPYMQAVRRYQSVDLPQNRLVKEFVTRVADLLELRKKHLGHEDDLLGDIYRWLRTDEAQEIGRWDNLPPNNTLLSHRDYRRVWDGWRWLQVLDDAIDRDFRHVEGRAATLKHWETLGKAYAEGKTLFGDMPVLFDYDSFTIKPWRKPIAHSGKPARPNRDRSPLEAPASVDLTYLRPRFAVGRQAAQALPEAYLWQRWTRDGESVDLELFYADTALLPPESTTISIADIFFAKDADESLVEWAAHAFARKLSKTFANPALIWLVPDFLNDFQLQAARRNINARFAKAEPLPRSVAAVIEQVDYSKIRGADFQVIVVDSTGGATYATKLTAQYDEELQQRVPETRGFYWERSPHVTLAHDAAYDPLVEMPRISRDGQRFDATPLPSAGHVSQNTLRNQMGDFDLVITVKGSPVRGGVRLHELQQRAGDIPLWRDHIPELSIKVINAGRYQPFFLVDRGTTIRPLRGVPVQIPVNNRFTLPAGRSHYQFPLFQGRDPDDLGYVARLESPAFPLASDATCCLTMTYTYGADDPYRLVFEPLDGSFAPVHVKWRPKTEEIITNAPAPEYPTPLGWSELRQWRDAQGNDVDLLAWLEDSFSRLVELVPEPVTIRICAPWKNKVDEQGKAYWFAFATTENGARCYCNTKQFCDGIDGDPNQTIPIGTELYAQVRDGKGGLSAFDIAARPGAISQRSKMRILQFKERSLQNRIATIWSDSRSLQDADCPNDFRMRVFEALRVLEERLPIDLYAMKMLPLLALMHKDASEPCINWVARQIGSREIHDPRAVGSALGNLELKWQREAFGKLTAKPSKSAVSALAYAIWRDQGFIRNFTLGSVCSVLDSIRSFLRSVQPFVQRDNDRDGRRYWSRGIAEPLELLLGLLRTRVSPEPELHMLLQPHQEITKSLASDIERVAEVVANSSAGLPSRVQMSNLPPKAAGDRTPPLLYALRLYLTGDVGANAIRVTGVNDGEDD
jgi:hypothetical protein